MSQGYPALTEKEKQTLRMLLAGHDAKSMARQLGLSVHTINERLREARRKLSASSSREAARLLREAEGDAPHFMGDDELGDAPIAQPDADPVVSIAEPPRRGFAVWIIGAIAMFALALALYAVTATPETPAVATPDSTAPSETAPVQSARQWLERGDAGDWPGSYAATAASFRKLNTLAVWEDVSKKVRVPLGALVSRTLIADEDIPTPPAGSRLVKFRSRFANRAEAVETLTLVKEDGGWRVAGIYIE